MAYLHSNYNKYIESFWLLGAYETCKLQTELTKNSFLPNIQVKENLEYYNKSDTVTNEVIEISNIEGRINNYCSKIITYIKCGFL